MECLRGYIALLFGLLVGQSFAQDIHWSQYNDNQLYQNPGNAGNFKGDYRFIGNFRQQWKSVTVPYTTFSCSADALLPKHKNWGLGLLFFNDAAGDGKFRTVELQLNTSYLLKLSADSAHTLRPGINLGINHRQVNWNQLNFDSQYNGMAFDPSLSTNETYQNQSNTNLSVGIGSVYEYFKNKHTKVSAGIGIFNLNQPNQGFFGEQIKRDIRTSVFVKGSLPVYNKVDLLPSLSFETQGKYRQLIIGTSCRYILTESPTVYKAVYAGVWFRNKDAGYISVGIDYQNWFAGLSYDINVSQLVPASTFRGGVELALRYIISRFKPTKIVHRICPDYI